MLKKTKIKRRNTEMMEKGAVSGSAAPSGGGGGAAAAAASIAHDKESWS
jgi:hypothetical protein